MNGYPVMGGHFLITMSYVAHVKEPVTKGHLSCGGTIPNMKGFTLSSGVISYLFTVVISC